MSEAAVHTGGCHCGALRYQASGEPSAATLCHCASCRRASGGPSVAWAVFPAAKVDWLSGVPREFESSPGKFWAFCEQCGSLVGYHRASRPGDYDITTATLDDPGGLPPTVEIWTGEKIAWEALDPEREHKVRSSLNESA